MIIRYISQPEIEVVVKEGGWGVPNLLSDMVDKINVKAYYISASSSKGVSAEGVSNKGEDGQAMLHS